jgi:predicted DNA binding CopG/RHH family protein
MARTKRDTSINLRVAAPLREALEAEAASTGRVLAEHVRQVLIDHLAQRVAVPDQPIRELHR